MAPPSVPVKKPKVLEYIRSLNNSEISPDPHLVNEVVRNISGDHHSESRQCRNQLDTRGTKVELTNLGPIPIGPEEVLRETQHSIVDEKPSPQVESREESSTVSELRDLFTRMNPTHRTEPSCNNDIDKPLPVETSEQEFPSVKSPNIDLAIGSKKQDGFGNARDGFLGLPSKGKGLFQNAFDKVSSSIVRSPDSTRRLESDSSNEESLVTQDVTSSKFSTPPALNTFVNNVKDGTNNLAVRGKEKVQTGFHKSTDSLVGLLPRKPAQNAEEAEIQMVDNDDLEDYINKTYGEDVYDTLTQIESEMDGSENTGPETTSSENSVKRASKWQLPDLKKLEAVVSNQLQTIKTTSQSAIDSAGRIAAPIGEATRTGIDTVGKKSSDMWQGSPAKDISVKISEDISDWKNSMLGKSGLCCSCEKFRLDSSMESDGEVIFKVPLERILYHKNWCRLCSYLLHHLFLPPNDPFTHPQIKNYLQPAYKNLSFKRWALSSPTLLISDARWPFGFGKDKHGGPFNYLDPILARHISKRNGKDTAKVLTRILLKIAIASKTKNAAALYQVPQQSPTERLRRARQEREYQELTHFKNLVHPLQCYLKVRMANRSDIARKGQVNVTLHAYGRGFGAQLATVSQFRLRIQSDLSIAYPLRYGLIVDPGTIDLSLGARWLHQCETVHGLNCSAQSWSSVVQAPRSLRMIDVDENCIVQVTNLQNFRFIALSYTWGSPGIEVMRLEQSNIKNLMVKNGLARFTPWIPQTVLDAIEVVKRLGERYLWVDALCIIQDIEDEEKHQQISAMDWLYGKAALTIVAADSKHSMAGIRGVRPATRELFQNKVDMDSGTLLTPLEVPQDLDKSSWNSRAWTLQEKLLSRRLLIFHGGQMIWHCRSSVYYEDMIAADKDPRQLGASLKWLSLRRQHLGNNGEIDGSLMVFQDQTTHVVRSETFKQYSHLVEEYTHRQLSYEEDILKAFGGLLRILQQFFKFPMIDGLPSILLDVALLWQPREQLEARKSSGNTKFPSWSWAGWKGRVRYAEPFYAGVNEQTSTLLRLPLTEDEDRRQERIRPLLRYYTMNESNGQLKPLNKTGLGIPLFSKNLPREWEKSPFVHFPVDERPVLTLSNEDLPPAMLANVDKHTLVFRTACVNSFDIENATSQDIDCVPPLARPPKRYNILNINRRMIGTLLLNVRGQYFAFQLGKKHEFILLSEAQFYGLDFESNGSRTRHSNEYPLYNVMLVEWDNGRTMAKRLGLGKVDKEEWIRAGPRAIIVSLQ